MADEALDEVHVLTELTVIGDDWQFALDASVDVKFVSPEVKLDVYERTV